MNCFLIQSIILACLLALAISMPLSDASCFLMPFKPGMSNGVVVGKKSTALNLTDIIRIIA